MSQKDIINYGRYYKMWHCYKLCRYIISELNLKYDTETIRYAWQDRFVLLAPSKKIGIDIFIEAKDFI